MPRAPIAAVTPPELVTLRLDGILESPHNPRQHYDEAKLRDLAASLAVGQTTPIIVRPHPTKKNHYELAAGHRRLRAAKLAGLDGLLAIVRPYTDAELLEVLTIENLQRDDVHPLDEAEGYAALMLQDKAHDVPWLAGRVGKSERYIHDRLVLRQLIAPLRALFLEGRIEVSHAVECAKLTSEQQGLVLHGGLFTREQLQRGEQDEFRFARYAAEDDESVEEVSADDRWVEQVRTERMKPVSVRELKGWIHRNTRLAADSPMIAIEFPETAETLAEATRREMRVYEISDDRDLSESAKAEGRRTLTADQWKAAEPESCGFLAIGFHVAGQRQGQSHLICTSKRKCEAHWQEEIAFKARAKARSTPAGDGDIDTWPGVHEPDEYEKRRQKDQAERERIGRALPAITDALAAAVKKSPAGLGGALSAVVLENLGAPSKDDLKAVTKGKSAEDLVRVVAWMTIAGDLENEWRWQHGLPELCKQFKVDFKALVKAANPKPPKTERATAPAKGGRRA